MSDFSTTHWSVVLAAGAKDPRGRVALETLCTSYRPVVKQFLRSRRLSEEDAEDMTQEFFADFLERQAIEKADPARGRFRNFLLASVTNFLRDEVKKATRLKRKPLGGLASLELLADVGLEIPDGEPSPEESFEIAWARAIQTQVLTGLRRNHEMRQKSDQFERLLPYLVDLDPPPYAETARALSASEAATKMMVSRLRRRFGTMFRRSVEATVESPMEVDPEMRFVLELLERHGGASSDLFFSGM